MKGTLLTSLILASAPIMAEEAAEEVKNTPTIIATGSNSEVQAFKDAMVSQNHFAAYDDQVNGKLSVRIFAKLQGSADPVIQQTMLEELIGTYTDFATWDDKINNYPGAESIVSIISAASETIAENSATGPFVQVTEFSIPPNDLLRISATTTYNVVEPYRDSLQSRQPAPDGERTLLSIEFSSDPIEGVESFAGSLHVSECKLGSFINCQPGDFLVSYQASVEEPGVDQLGGRISKALTLFLKSVFNFEI